ncbi:basic salivary proline-rich protein 4-like [Bos javanicus]|uniref:basic salivary proline-rich protein 4-like n=1 Tax=Bos javanicus TaxID=9906 RepID=UPI002AA8C96E|nr:basic salivary proline-rich protein 4-like [Bos javanicus]
MLAVQSSIFWGVRRFAKVISADPSSPSQHHPTPAPCSLVNTPPPPPPLLNPPLRTVCDQTKDEGERTSAQGWGNPTQKPHCNGKRSRPLDDFLPVLGQPNRPKKKKKKKSVTQADRGERKKEKAALPNRGDAAPGSDPHSLGTPVPLPRDCLSRDLPSPERTGSKCGRLQRRPGKHKVVPCLSRSRRPVRGQCAAVSRPPPGDPQRGCAGSWGRGHGTPRALQPPPPPSRRRGRPRLIRGQFLGSPRKTCGGEKGRPEESRTPLPVRLHLLHVAHNAPAAAPGREEPAKRASP